MPNPQDRFTALMSSPLGRSAVLRMLVKAEQSVKLSTRQGKARGGGQSSKAKGRTAVVAIRDLLAEHLGIPVDSMMVKATSMPGVDLYIDPKHKAVFPFSIEGKAVEALNIFKALAQAIENTEPGTEPVVFFKRARTPMFAAIPAETFLRLVRSVYGEGRTVREGTSDCHRQEVHADGVPG